jgi:hypothetical protein
LSRWGPKPKEDLPQSAEEYETWFREQVELYKRNPGKDQLIGRKQTPSAWQMEGLRLVMEKRAKKVRVFDW